MHISAHASRLPEDIAPIPDSYREAEVLLMLLNAVPCPKCADEKCTDGRERRDGKEPAREGEG
jgi:hypothetical protein